MPKLDLLVSVVAVLHNQAEILVDFVHDLLAVLDEHYTNYEIILLDNGCIDKTASVAKGILSQQKCIRYLQLNRLTDLETALLAGLDTAIGDYVVTLNPDYDPPSELVAMVETCRSGSELVLGVDRNPNRQGYLYRRFRKVYYWLARQFLGFSPIRHATGFRVFSRQATNALVQVRMRRRYFSVVAAIVGLKIAVHPYDLKPRSGRYPSFPLLSSIRMGLSRFIHNSLIPLRFSGTLGLLGSLLSFSYSFYVVLIFFFKKEVVPGWTTLSLMMSGLFALMFLILGLMGEYLRRLLEESTEQPLYLLRNEQSSAIMLSDHNRLNVLGQSDSPVPAATDKIH